MAVRRHVLNFTAFNLNLKIVRVYFVFLHIQHFALPFHALDRYQMDILKHSLSLNRLP